MKNPGYVVMVDRYNPRVPTRYVTTPHTPGKGVCDAKTSTDVNDAMVFVSKERANSIASRLQWANKAVIPFAEIEKE